MKPRYYLAYGSNLNLDQMSRRCPTARIAGDTVLEGYELKFRGEDGCAVATVEPGEGAVPALLWTLRPRDELALDRYEGFPFFYRKEVLEVERKGKPVTAMVYIMNEGPELGAPSQRYFDTIREGYKTAGFDMAILDMAVERSHVPQRMCEHFEPQLEL